MKWYIWWCLWGRKQKLSSTVVVVVVDFRKWARSQVLLVDRRLPETIAATIFSVTERLYPRSVRSCWTYYYNAPPAWGGVFHGLKVPLPRPSTPPPASSSVPTTASANKHDSRGQQNSSHSRSCCSGREQRSCVAVLLGAFGLSCLVTALMTDLWVHTVESVGSRNVFSADLADDFAGYSRIEFDVGLWRVCPSMRSQFFAGEMTVFL
jgi:hypothetical protein